MEPARRLGATAAPSAGHSPASRSAAAGLLGHRRCTNGADEHRTPTHEQLGRDSRRARPAPTDRRSRVDTSAVRALTPWKARATAAECVSASAHRSARGRGLGVESGSGRRRGGSVGVGCGTSKRVGGASNRLRIVRATVKCSVRRRSPRRVVSEHRAAPLGLLPALCCFVEAGAAPRRSSCRCRPDRSHNRTRRSAPRRRRGVQDRGPRRLVGPSIAVRPPGLMRTAFDQPSRGG
jgi:hypothetical protein